MLRQNVMNADMSQPEFEYNIDKAEHRLSRQVRILRYAASKGYRSDEYWDFVDKTIASEGDPTIEPEAIKMRGDELKAMYSQQYSGDELMKKVQEQLSREGYFK